MYVSGDALFVRRPNIEKSRQIIIIYLFNSFDIINHVYFIFDTHLTSNAKRIFEKTNKCPQLRSYFVDFIEIASLYIHLDKVVAIA